ncbi:MAG: hypothetical protein JO267_02830 [Alphaproteobacteria bacterium]|nr:hypothetical protein [Alphaproteobacteria bacterium]MBV9861063.1 hypothetical protein [Alphaproteobacteria bacterium]
MNEKSQPNASQQRNEGEGNKTAAREYNKAQHEFAQSGKVEEKAREAEKALNSDERREMERAEAVGKRHIAAEDPAVKKR